MASHHVSIGPEFFLKAKNDYADWRWALIREFMQNCLDAPGCQTVQVDISYQERSGETVLKVGNDGAPMSHEILTKKLLSLGGSGKGFQGGAVGGFGKAKELLYFCHRHYRIRTGSMEVRGSGATYEMDEGLGHLHGTLSTVYIAEDVALTLSNAVRRFALCCQWSGRLFLNGEQLATDLKKGSRRREFPWGVVYTNNSIPNTMIARVNGTPMFTKAVRYKGTVLIELSGASADVLASNRDCLRWSPQCDLDDFLADIAVNTRSALKDKTRKTERVRFSGFKLQGVEADPGQAVRLDPGADNARKVLVAISRATGASEGGKAPAGRGTDTVDLGRSPVSEAPVLTKEEVERVFRPEFFLKSEIGGKIPEWFTPGTFSDNSLRLLTNWVGILVELAALTGLSRPFSVGFIFDPDVEGQYEKTADGEHVVYVSPAIVSERSPNKPRQLKVRWKFDAAGNWRLLALAVHEFVHLEGHVGHDEDYAARITDLFALVMANRIRFSRHFTAPVIWPR